MESAAVYDNAPTGMYTQLRIPGSLQPAYARSLIREFARYSLHSQVAKVSFSAGGN